MACVADRQALRRPQVELLPPIGQHVVNVGVVPDGTQRERRGSGDGVIPATIDRRTVGYSFQLTRVDEHFKWEVRSSGRIYDEANATLTWGRQPATTEP